MPAVSNVSEEPPKESSSVEQFVTDAAIKHQAQGVILEGSKNDDNAFCNRNLEDLPIFETTIPSQRHETLVVPKTPQPLHKPQHSRPPPLTLASTTTLGANDCACASWTGSTTTLTVHAQSPQLSPKPSSSGNNLTPHPSPSASHGPFKPPGSLKVWGSSHPGEHYGPQTKWVPQQQVETQQQQSQLQGLLGRRSTEFVRQAQAMVRRFKQLQRSVYFLYVVFLIGTAIAVVHHGYYSALHGLHAGSEQQWAERLIGTALSLAARTVFAHVVTVAFRQRVWVAVSRSMLPIQSVNALFSASYDFVSLANQTLWLRGAGLAMMLVVFKWCVLLQLMVSFDCARSSKECSSSYVAELTQQLFHRVSTLIVILASNTISITPVGPWQAAHCYNALTFNFSLEYHDTWRPLPPEMIHSENDYMGSSAWNRTAPDMTFADQLHPNLSRFDYYNGFSLELDQAALRSLKTGRALGWPEGRERICGPRALCRYTVEFVGPGYQCKELARGVNSTVMPLSDGPGRTSPIDYESLLPIGPTSYKAVLFEGEYHMPQFVDNYTSEGLPPPRAHHPTTGALPPLTGAFRTEPVLWIGYSDPPRDANLQTLLPLLAADPEAWYARFTPAMIACEHYKVRYNVTFTYGSPTSTSDFTYTVNTREFLRRVIDTDFDRDQGDDSNPLLSDTNIAFPVENYVRATDYALYRETATYHSLGLIFRDRLDGWVGRDRFTASEVLDLNGLMLTTRLIDDRHMTVVPNFAEELPRVYEEMVFSLMHDPRFSVVASAGNPAVTFTNKTANAIHSRIPYPCQKASLNVWTYRPGMLWAVYGAAIALAGIAVILGHSAAANSGELLDVSFSSIVAATRGPHLDDLDWTLTHGRLQPVTDASEIGYGVVDYKKEGDDFEPVYGFGTQRTMSQGNGEGVAEKASGLRNLLYRRREYHAPGRGDKTTGNRIGKRTSQLFALKQ